MHELSLIENTLEIAQEQARQKGALRIHQLRLRVGELSGVVAEALRFAFEVASSGTLAEGARLDIEWVSVICLCQKCKREFRPERAIYECPDCGCFSADFRQGRELELVSLEVS